MILGDLGGIERRGRLDSRISDRSMNDSVNELAPEE